MKNVIFDMDGIIFDSERATFDSWAELCERKGIKDLEIPYMKCIGVNAPTSRRIFLDFYGEDFPFDEYNAERSAAYHRKYDGGNMPLKKGARELLQYLKSEGAYVALGSSTRTVIVRKQIDEAGLTEYFNRIVGGDMVERSKPEPDVFLEGIKGTGIKPEDTFVIEDSYNGIRAAKAAGMKAIMVPDMLPPDEEMKALADYILPDLCEVKKLFETLK